MRKECVPALKNRSKWNSESRHLKPLIETDMPDISDFIRRSRRSELKTVIAAAGTPAEFCRSTNKMAKCFAGVGIGDVDFVTMIDTPKVDHEDNLLQCIMDVMAASVWLLNF